MAVKDNERVEQTGKMDKTGSRYIKNNNKFKIRREKRNEYSACKINE